MINIEGKLITIQLEKENPERFAVQLGRAITETTKIVVESQEIFNDADVPDHVHRLMDLYQALQMDEKQLKAAGMFGNIESDTKKSGQ